MKGDADRDAALPPLGDHEGILGPNGEDQLQHADGLIVILLLRHECLEDLVLHKLRVVGSKLLNVHPTCFFLVLFGLLCVTGNVAQAFSYI